MTVDVFQQRVKPDQLSKSIYFYTAAIKSVLARMLLLLINNL